MRDLKTAFDAIANTNEKLWDSRLFIDKALKNETEHTLGIIAKALAGRYKIVFNSQDAPYEKTEDICGDNSAWVKVTTKHKLMVNMRDEDSGYVFYGNNKIEIFVQIINFWAGRCSIFPCAGAQIKTVERE